MTNSPFDQFHIADSDRRLSLAHGLVLAVCFALYFVLRLPWADHLLAVDEANTLLSVRAFASGGSDFYSNWFWRRPPLLNTMLLLARPLQDGFIWRAEILVVLVGAFNLLALFILSRRSLGLTAALWSVFLLVAAPGANFFDVWIKQDGPCVFFGLLAIHFFLARKHVLSGVALGLGFLAKEMALYYAAAIVLLWLFEGRGRQSIRIVGVIPMLTAVVSGWWYLFFTQSIHNVILAVTGSSEGAERGWLNPWYYMFAKFPVDLGWHGIVLCLAGLIATCVLFQRRKAGAIGFLWPLALLAPALIIISASRSKTPWYTIPLYPALAALQAMGVGLLMQAVRYSCGKFRWSDTARQACIAAAILLVAGISVFGVSNRNYEDAMRRQSYWMWWGAYQSRNTASVMNKLVGDDERAMITPMFYWDYGNARPCSIFTCYLKNISVLVRRNDIPADGVIDDVKRYRLDWVMVSVPPGEGKKALIDTMTREYGLYPLLLEGACIFKTDSIYKADISPRSE